MSIFTSSQIIYAILIWCIHIHFVHAFYVSRTYNNVGLRRHHQFVEGYSSICHTRVRAVDTITVNNKPSGVPPCFHTINGIECVEVSIDISSLGEVVVLEATATSQEVLVNWALGEENSDSSAVARKLHAGDPYGAVLWPAAYAVATKILTSESYKSLQNYTVLELGAGTGLVSLALLKAGVKQVIATDYEEIPLQLIEYAAKNLNAISSIGQLSQLKYKLLDMRNHTVPLPAADLVVAADIMYEPKTGIAMANRAVEALRRGSRVIVGDSPGRPGRKAFLDELQRLGVKNAAFVDTIGYTCTGARHDLICGPQSTSVSKNRQELSVAVMELVPTLHLPDTRHS